ncbi:kinase-like domain-containing protein, partial [Auriculariales sp. MPI-PUGE-AT-0066]
QISSTENKIRKEIAIMRKCSHQHIVRLYEVIDDPSAKKVYLIMEYCAGGEVKWRTPDNKPKLSLFQIRHILRDISLGLEYLHYQGIIHRDVKPANILYTKNRTMVKLADLGSAHFSYAQRLALAGHDEANLDEPLDQVLMNDKDITRTAGSPAFFSPELCYQGEDLNKPNEQLDPKYRITNAIDIWALGITLFAFLYGDIPWKNVQSEFAIYSVIVEETIVFPSEMGVERITLATEAPDSIASQAHDLLNRMLQKDPSKRATIADIKVSTFRHTIAHHLPSRRCKPRRTPRSGPLIGTTSNFFALLHLFTTALRCHLPSDRPFLASLLGPLLTRFLPTASPIH